MMTRRWRLECKVRRRRSDEQPPKQAHPDFVILHPRRGLLILEVKDWRLDAIRQAGNQTSKIIPGGQRLKSPIAFGFQMHIDNADTPERSRP